MMVTAVQRDIWGRRLPGSAIARALRLTGSIDDGRLASAAQEVTAAFPVLCRGIREASGELLSVDVAAPEIRGETVLAADREAACLALIEAERQRVVDPGLGPLCRVLLHRLSGNEVVLAVVADPLQLDLRSVYLLLGAILQAYFGRFRIAEYPEAAGEVEVSPSNKAWWAERIRHRPHWTPAARPGGGGFTLPLSRERWTRLCQIGDHAGNTSSLAVVALLSWWLRSRAGHEPPVRFTAELDLREYQGMGPVVGPLTDRIAFEVAATDGLSFRDLVRRSHAGLLDAVVRYVPSETLVGLGGWPGDQAAVHYCRTPPASSSTRDDQSVARLGMAIELFHEVDLAQAPACESGGALEVDIAEAGEGVALIARSVSPAFPAHQMALLRHDLDRAIDIVIADHAALTEIGG